MDSRFSFGTIYFIFFATCIRQGYTRRKQAIEVDGTAETGSNVTNVLQKIILSNGKIVIEQQNPADSGNYDTWKNTVENALMKYLFGPKKDTDSPTPSGQVQSSGRSGLWGAAKSFINDLTVALSSNTDGQAIVQPSLDNDKYSLLQDMQSGRIRGPAHVYGRHVGIGRSGETGESSDDD